MSGLCERQFVIYDLPLPLPETVKILHPEQAVVRLGGKYTIDIGSLCYLRRGVKFRSRYNVGQTVEEGTLSVSRITHIRALIAYFSGQVEFSGKRISTLHASFTKFVNSFMAWADCNGHSGVFDGKDSARKALVDYVLHLRDRVLRNDFGVNSATVCQNIAIEILKDFLRYPNLAQGINLLQKSDSARESTSTPCEVAQSKVLSLSESIFSCLSDNLVDNKPYPFRMEMPKYLGWDQDFIWVFPTSRWCMPPHQLREREKLKSGSWAYDYYNGKLSTFEAIADKYSVPFHATSALRKARLQFITANSEPHNYFRRRLAMMAVNAFSMMFIANTGMNVALFLDLSWGNDYEVGIERQGFRAVKWRAKGRPCHFEIAVSFLPQFKRYLKLREYLLNGSECDTLFFSLGANLASGPKPMDVKIFSEFHKSLLNFDRDLPSVSPREWRAAKFDWLIKKTDITTAAIIMNSAEKTARKSYVAGSETEHIEEMSLFFESVANIVVSKEELIVNGVERAVGVCSSFGSPHENKQNAPVAPDCKNPEGCLFCDKFKVHSDDRDTRKLLSCQYCLNQTAYLASSEEQYQILFAPILDRILEILDEISKRDPEIVKRISKEVDEGELDPFWASKLEMLIELELV